MKSILYIMHVPWGWIKQRPHFIAEYLNEDYSVDVVYRKPLTINEKNLKETKVDSLSIKRFVSLPFKKIPVLRKFNLNWINRLLFKWKIGDVGKYDIIWLCSLDLYNLVKKDVTPNQKVIFDCMDDELEFPAVLKNTEVQESLLQTEKELVKRADLIIFSSNYLLDKTRTRSGQDFADKSIVVNNALNIPETSGDQKDSDEKFELLKEQKKGKLLIYIGTISEWFDFELLEKCLNNVEGVKLILIGPTHVELSNHPKIIHLGIIEHRRIYDFMSLADALVMPFKINELIKSVNPVKLYEYIYSSKPVIAPKYSESLPFERFVNLYDNEREFIDLVRKLVENELVQKRSLDEINEFSRANSWPVRVKKEIKEKIDKLFC